MAEFDALFSVALEASITAAHAAKILGKEVRVFQRAGL